MQSMLVKVCLVCLGCVMPVAAGPFNAAWVSGDANWVVHLNLDALRGSQIGQAMLAEELDAAAQEPLQQAQEMLGMDPRTDLNGVTLYGTADAQEDFVAIVRGNFDVAKLLSHVENASGYAGSRLGSRDVHSWLVEEGIDESRMFGTVLDNSRVMISRSVAQLEKGLAVLDGAQGNISAGSELDTRILSGQGVMLAVTADLRDVEFPQNPMMPQANVNIRNFLMQMRETDGTLGLRVAAQQGSVQEAQQAEEMLNGFKMMGLMHLQQENPDLASLLQAITVGRNEATLLLGLSYSSEKLINMMKEAAAPFVSEP